MLRRCYLMPKRYYRNGVTEAVLPQAEAVTLSRCYLSNRFVVKGGGVLHDLLLGGTTGIEFAGNAAIAHH